MRTSKADTMIAIVEAHRATVSDATSISKECRQYALDLLDGVLLDLLQLILVESAAEPEG